MPVPISWTMRISGNEKSTLFGFLKAILGRAPQYGWDYCELKGTRCLLTVEHAPRRDGSGVFPSVAALSPVPTGFAGPARQEPAAGGRGTGDGRQSRAEARRRRGERLRISRIARMGRRETVSRGGAETQRREATDFADGEMVLMKQNATTEMLLAAMMAATPERKKDALLVLRGEASVADGGRGAGAGARRGLEPFVGIREVAEFLNVSARSVKRWRVPGHKLGGRCCFRMSEVASYLESEAFRARLDELREGRETSGQ